MRTRLAWQDSATAYPSPIPSAWFPIGVQSMGRYAAGAATTHFAAAKWALRPLAAAARIESRQRPTSVWLPEAARTSAPAAAEARSPQLRATLPALGEPAATGRVARAYYVIAMPSSIRIAGPVVPAGPESAPEVNLAPAAMACPPRLLEAAPGRLARAHHAIAMPSSTRIAGPRVPAGPESAPEVNLAPAAMACPPRLLEAATGRLARAHHAIAMPSSTRIAGPRVPAGPESAPEVNLAPAASACQPPVAFEAPGARGSRIILPKLAAASSSLCMAPAEHVQMIRPEPSLPAAAQPTLAGAALFNRLGPMLPDIQAALPVFEQIESATRQSPDLAPMSPTADPQPGRLPAASPAWCAARTEQNGNPLDLPGGHVHPQIELPAATMGALAGLVRGGTPLVQEAVGHLNLRVAAASARIPAPVAPRSLSGSLGALPGEIGSAPILQAGAPASALPHEAAPSWSPARAESPNHALLPLANFAIPRVDWLPVLAGSVAGVHPAWPGVGRTVRTCAVLWTLRMARMCHPVFRADPVKALFNDLVPATMPFAQDLEDKPPAKTKVLPFKRPVAARSSRPKWLYAVAAAAALLLAGVLSPQLAPKGFSASLPWRGMSVGKWVSQRATRTYGDDFRAGMDQWKSVQPKSAQSWSYSRDGFMHPGQLALYRPSVPLSDYRFEFLAQVESKSVDWVVRATDADNYYAMKFTVLQPGPRPTVAMVRYPVIGGRRGARVQTPLRMMIHADTPYRVTVDVKGNRFRTFVEGQEADNWTDDTLKTGGVGFFRETGERARVYWVKVESHGDMLGGICGWLSGKSSEGATDIGEKSNGLPEHRYHGNNGGGLLAERGKARRHGAGWAYQPCAVEGGSAASGWQAGGGGQGAGGNAGRRRTPPGIVLRAGPVAIRTAGVWSGSA